MPKGKGKTNIEAKWGDTYDVFQQKKTNKELHAGIILSRPAAHQGLVAKKLNCTRCHKKFNLRQQGIMNPFPKEPAAW